jgi:UDP-N-acetylglucosamine--N-acetylmuramyl-(pentapeptide) pyrophosphoryl-undecaprenol N-acetylglucosamine transferase
VGYDSQMESLYSTAAVLACRAGAVTVAELAVTGMPSVLVPLANAPDDHQTKNAQALVDVGAAVLVPEEELTGARLAECLDALLVEGAQLERMSAAARTLARPDAAARVATLVEEVAGAAA